MALTKRLRFGAAQRNVYFYVSPLSNMTAMTTKRVMTRAMDVGRLPSTGFVFFLHAGKHLLKLFVCVVWLLEWDALRNVLRLRHGGNAHYKHGVTSGRTANSWMPVNASRQKPYLDNDLVMTVLSVWLPFFVKHTFRHRKLHETNVLLPGDNDSSPVKSKHTNGYDRISDQYLLL